MHRIQNRYFYDHIFERHLHVYGIIPYELTQSFLHHMDIKDTIRISNQHQIRTSGIWIVIRDKSMSLNEFLWYASRLALHHVSMTVRWRSSIVHG